MRRTPNARDIAAVGYGGGVPMGGDLAQAPERHARILVDPCREGTP